MLLFIGISETPEESFETKACQSADLFHLCSSKQNLGQVQAYSHLTFKISPRCHSLCFYRRISNTGPLLLQQWQTAVITATVTKGKHPDYMYKHTQMDSWCRKPIWLLAKLWETHAHSTLYSCRSETSRLSSSAHIQLLHLTFLHPECSRVIYIAHQLSSDSFVIHPIHMNSSTSAWILTWSPGER